MLKSLEEDLDHRENPEAQVSTIVLLFASVVLSDHKQSGRRKSDLDGMD